MRSRTKACSRLEINAYRTILRWLGVLALLLAGAVRSTDGAILSTGASLRVEWQVTGIPDGQLNLIRLVSNTDYYYHAIYSAPLRALEKVEASATGMVEPIITLTNWSVLDRILTIDIPYGSTVWRSELVQRSFTNIPTTLHQSHSDPFAPNQSWPGIRIRYTGRDMLGFYQGLQQRDIYIDVVPEEAFQIGYYKWLQGLPEFSGFRFQKPDGCGGCQPMGLPVFHVNPTTLNLVIQDTDFSYRGLGPAVNLTRTWNADTTWIGMFGRGWRFAYEGWLQDSPASTVVTLEDGQVLNFPLAPGVIGTNVASASGGYTIVMVSNGSAVASLMPGGYPYDWSGLFSPAAGSMDRLTYQSNSVNGKYEYRFHEKANGLTWLFAATNLFRTNAPLVSVEDEHGLPITLQRDTQGRLTNLVDAAGRSTRFAYNAQGLCTSMWVTGRGAATFTYDTNFNLTSSRDLAGNTTLFKHDPEGFVTNLSTEGRAWSFSWDTFRWKKLQYVIDPQNHTTMYYVVGGLEDIGNRTLRMVDPASNRTRAVSSGGFVTSFERRDGGVTTISYTNGMPGTEQNALYRNRRMTYDERNNLIQHMDYAGGTQRFAYDAQDRLIAHSNELGHATRFYRDASGSVTQHVWPSGRTVTMTYDSSGQLLSRRDPAGNATTFTYDAFGNVRSMTDPEGYTTRFGYDASGMDLVAVTNARGFVTRFEYDANRRLTLITHPDGTTRRFEYDCCTQTGVVNEAGARTSVQRDLWQRVLSSTDPLGRTTRFAYDANGRLVARTNALGQVRKFGHDAEDRLVAITNELGDATKLVRDKEGTILNVQVSDVSFEALSPAPAGPAKVTFTYNANSRIRTSDSPSTTFDRDARGRLTNRTPGVRFAYDADDRLLTIAYTNEVQSSNTYDAVGNLERSTCAEGTVQFLHDRRSLVTNILHRDGRRTAIRYDANGNVAEISQPGGMTAAYTRDERDRITHLVWNGHVIEFDYDLAGRVIRETRSNGTETRTAYDAAGRIVTNTHTGPQGTLLSLRLERDALGRTTNIVRQAGLLPTQPVLSQLTATAVHNSRLQIATYNSNSLTYDARWNLAAATGFVQFAASYDPQDQPLSITVDGITSTYAYDGLGYRVRRTMAGVTRRYHHTRNGHLLYETDANHTILRHYVYAQGRLIAMASGNDTWFFHFDANGNTLFITDKDGAIAAHYRYLPDGTSGGSFARVENPFTFSGAYGVMDDGGGLYFMRNRTYYAPLRRFLQPDPAGLLGGSHWYSYAAGNPVDRIDPDGLSPQAIDLVDQLSEGEQTVDFVEAILENELQNSGVDLWGRLNDIIERRKAREAEGPCVITPDEAKELQAQFDSLPDSFDPRPPSSAGEAAASSTFSIPQPTFPEFSLDEN